MIGWKRFCSWFWDEQYEDDVQPPPEIIAVEKNKAYWDAKHPLVDQLYNGRPLPTGGAYSMDVRNFIWPDDLVLKDLIKRWGLAGDSMESSVQKVQKWVVGNIKYVEDTTIGAAEFWLFAPETLAMGQGDCEDGAILIASLLLNILPESEHWRVRIAAGMVQASPTAPQGGHGYVTFCRPQDNEHVVVDWCYLEDSGISVKDKPLHRDNAPYKDVWFSFNHAHAWAHQTFALSGRLKQDDDDRN